MDEVSNFKTKSQMDKIGKILKLCPFPQEPVLWVDGRLVRVNLPVEAKYQKVVPPGSQFA